MKLDIKDLEVGITYEIRHSRKGNFFGTLEKFFNGKSYASFRIASGEVKYLSKTIDNKVEGDIVDLKLSMGTFYTIEKYISIPPERWGKDHWSTFLYIETRCVDYGGKINNDHMRTKQDKHPNLVGEAQTSLGVVQRNCATRLKNYFNDKSDKLDDHDDWDCVVDMTAAGLLECSDVNSINKKLDFVFKMTVLGYEVIMSLRKHKADGGHCSNFEWSKNK